MPSFRRLAREASGKGIQVLAISVGEARGQVAEFIEHEPLPGTTVLADVKGEVFQSFRMRGHPSLVMVDAEGNRRWASYSMDAALNRWDSLGKKVRLFITDASMPRK